MSTIPISQIVNIQPSVLAAAGAAIDLNGLILTQDPAIPVGTVKAFALADDVGTFFGLTSTEYELAKVYFGGYVNATKAPGILYMMSYHPTAAASWLRSASLSGVSLATIKAVTGSLSVTIDGTVHSASSIDLSASTSFADAAAHLSTALSASVTFDVQRQAFVITSGTQGAASSVGFASGTAAAALYLTAATGAEVSAGTDAMTPATAMAAVLGIQQNWCLFTTTWEPVLDDKKAFSSWANSQKSRFAYVGWDTDATAINTSSSASWGDWLKADSVGCCVPIYGTPDHAAFVLGFAASLDFDRRNGRTTLAFKYQEGLTPYVTNASNAAALKSKGYNYFGAYSTAKETFNFTYAGSISGTWKWLDTFLNQVWMSANLQLALVKLLMNVGSIPYNSEGYGLVEAAMLDPINAAVNFGAIRAGVTPSSSQAAQMQYALGRDVQQAFVAKGWVLQIDPATAAVRVERASPPITFYYADGESIQSLTVASIAVQ